MTARSEILIIGTWGMLGRELAAACGRREMDARAIANEEVLDITDAGAVRQLLGSESPKIVINAAGYTDVDGAEAEPDLADQVNRAGPANLAETCQEIGALLVHYSTDYVFDGRTRRPYRAEDTPNPINAYGRSKFAGERAVIESGCEHLLLRSSWLFAPHGRNFVRAILDLARQRPTLDVVDDQHGRPTYAADLAQMTLDLVEHEARGIFHAANAGQCSWHELAAAIVELTGLECDIRPCATTAVVRPAQRPSFSVLDLSATVALIGERRHWKVALAECIEQLTAQRVSQSP